MSANRIRAFCAFCKVDRMVYRKKRVGLFEVAGSALGAGAVMLAFYGEWDPRFFLIFVVLLAVAETFVQFRWRVSTVCPHCGFDPVLYLKDQKAAADKVSAVLQKRKDDPSMYFARPLNIPTRRKISEPVTPPVVPPKAQVSSPRTGPSRLSKTI